MVRIGFFNVPGLDRLQHDCRKETSLICKGSRAAKALDAVTS